MSEKKKDDKGGIPGADALGAAVPDVGAVMEPVTGILETMFPQVKMAMDAMTAISGAMKPAKQVPEPDMQKFTMAISEAKLKPVIEEKIVYHELFQPPEKEPTQNPLAKDGPTTESSSKSTSNEYNCKQSGGDGEDLVNTKLKEIIEEKLDCKHIKELIVTNFEKFIDQKVVHPHFHSISEKTNNLNTVSIFYRHGLSKIVSKIMDDIKLEPETLKFFLDEIMTILESMEDEKLMEYIYGFDDKLIFEMINDDNIKKLANENSRNKDKMNKLLIELYSESEFNTLINDLVMNKQMSEMDMKSWRKIYKDFQLKEQIKEDANRKGEIALLDKMGVEKVKEIFGLKESKKTLPNMATDFVNEFTDYTDTTKYGGSNSKKGINPKKRNTRKKRNAQRTK